MVFTRPGLNSVYANAIPFPILYCSEYNRTGSEKYNLFLDNQGNVYIEDVINTPGQYVLLLGNLVSPGDYVNITTADPGGAGLVRAWFASFSGDANGLENGGSDIPVYYDGNNLTRVTQDGPSSNITISENVANIAINYITQPAFIGPTANAPAMTMETTTINTFTNVGGNGQYTGTGDQTNPTPIINGTSLSFNQIINNFPVRGYYGESTKDVGEVRPVNQQQQDDFGNWTSDVAIPETNPGGKQGKSFDMNIQGNFVVTQTGNYTFYIQADATWVLFVGNGATSSYGYTDGPIPASKAGLTLMGGELNPTGAHIDTVVINFPTQAAYPFEFGYAAVKGNPITYLAASYMTGNVANLMTIWNSATSNITIPNPPLHYRYESNTIANVGLPFLPNPSGVGITLTEAGNEVTALLPVQHPFGVNDYALVKGFDVTQYNGIVQVTSVPDKKSFTWESDISGLAKGTGGTISPITATCVTNPPHGMILGDQITIVDNTQPIYCTANTVVIANTTTINPATWSVSGVVDPYTFQFNTLISSGNIGTGGYIGGGGLISPGIHEGCCSFILEDGSITAPGPIFQWTSTGFKKFTAYNLPIGPPNVQGRILHFTGAGGASFFDIPATPIGQQNLFGGQSSQVVIGTSTVVNDNTSTSVTLDFADATLFAGNAIDIAGNDLFNQVTLAPSIGCIEYADRMFWWGEINKIQNLKNMGFNSDYDTNYSPSGWNIGDQPNSTVAYDNLQGLSYCITGNSSVVQQGLISQNAYQDYFNTPIVSPNTLYRFSAKVKPCNLSLPTFAVWNYQDNIFQDFSQTIATNNWSKIDPNANISINSLSGLSMNGGSGIPDTSYYQFNYPVSIPTVDTPGGSYITVVPNITSTTYTPNRPSGSVQTSTAGTAINYISPWSQSTGQGGQSNISTANMAEFTFSFTETSNIPSGGTANTSAVMSFDNGRTYPQTLFTYSGTGPTSNTQSFSIPITNISSLCPSLANIKIEISTVSTHSGLRNLTVSNISGVSNAISSYSNITNYFTGNLMVSGVELNSTSTGNILQLYSENISGTPEISPGNVFLGVNIGSNVSTNSNQLNFNVGNVSYAVANIPSGNVFNVILSCTPTANGNVTVCNLSIPGYGSATANISNVTIENQNYNFVIADNSNITGNILSATLSSWPVETTTASGGQLPTVLTIPTLTSGNLTSQLYSPSLGTLAQGSFNLLGAPTGGEFLTVTFDRKMPPVIPSDLQLTIFGTSIPDGQIIALNDMLLIPDNYSVSETQLRASYVANPTAYDDVTGKIILPIAGEPIRTCFVLRDLLYICTPHHIFATSDNKATEPSGWEVTQITNSSVGALGPLAKAIGRKDAFVLDRAGMFQIDGSNLQLVTEEILPIWTRINPAYAHICWAFNDIQNRKTYIGLALDNSSTINQVILVNTRGLDPMYDIAEPVHVSTFSGKLLASDKTLKFAPWTPNLNYACLLNVDDSTERTTFCGPYGNLYWLNSNKFQDSDFGNIGSTYTTYFFLSDDQSTALQMDASRKLYTYLTASLTGTGNIQITPYVNNLTNAWKPLSQRLLSSTSNYDTDWNLNVAGNRVAFQLAPIPNANGDSYFSLSKFNVWMQNDPTSPVRGK